MRSGTCSLRWPQHWRTPRSEGSFLPQPRPAGNDESERGLAGKWGLHQPEVLFEDVLSFTSFYPEYCYFVCAVSNAPGVRFLSPKIRFWKGCQCHRLACTLSISKRHPIFNRNRCGTSASTMPPCCYLALPCVIQWLDGCSCWFDIFPFPRSLITRSSSLPWGVSTCCVPSVRSLWLSHFICLAVVSWLCISGSVVSGSLCPVIPLCTWEWYWHRFESKSARSGKE